MILWRAPCVQKETTTESLRHTLGMPLTSLRRESSPRTSKLVAGISGSAGASVPAAVWLSRCAVALGQRAGFNWPDQSCDHPSLHMHVMKGLPARHYSVGATGHTFEQDRHELLRARLA